MSTTAWLRPRTKIEQTPQANWPPTNYLGFEIDMDQTLSLAAILLAVSFGVLFAVRAALRTAPADY
jgi:hypothetical protein